jgi:hypothetical protein
MMYKGMNCIIFGGWGALNLKTRLILRSHSQHTVMKQYQLAIRSTSSQLKQACITSKKTVSPVPTAVEIETSISPQLSHLSGVASCGWLRRLYWQNKRKRGDSGMRNRTQYAERSCGHATAPYQQGHGTFSRTWQSFTDSKTCRARRSGQAYPSVTNTQKAHVCII